jgi:hypothetical protein
MTIFDELRGYLETLEKDRAQHLRTHKRLLGEMESLEMTLSKVDESKIDPVHRMILEHRASDLTARTQKFVRDVERTVNFENAVLPKIRQVISVLKEKSKKLDKPLTPVGRWIT